MPAIVNGFECYAIKALDGNIRSFLLHGERGGKGCRDRGIPALELMSRAGLRAHNHRL